MNKFLVVLNPVAGGKRGLRKKKRGSFTPNYGVVNLEAR